MVVISYDPCRNPVFYLLSALGSDQQDEHTRVLLAFFTLPVASKSLLISLLFLERTFLFFRHFPCGEHLCFTSFLSRSMTLRGGAISTI